MGCAGRILPGAHTMLKWGAGAPFEPSALRLAVGSGCPCGFQPARGCREGLSCLYKDMGMTLSPLAAESLGLAGEEGLSPPV